MTDFSRTHPLTLFCYFASAVTATLLTRHPVILALSGTFSLIYALYKEKAQTALKALVFAVAIALFIIITNSIFASEGETELFSLGKAAITLEEIYYGVALAASFASVIFWFRFLNKTLSDDKFIYLFGSVLPRTGATLALSLKSISLFRKKAEDIKEALVGLDGGSKRSVFSRMRRAARVFLGLFAWSFENVADTAAAMRARGYGLKPRTRYARYRFRFSDGLLTVFAVAVVAAVIFGVASGELAYAYYPRPGAIAFGWEAICAYSLCGMFFAWPLISEIKEIYKWRSLKFAI